MAEPEKMNGESLDISEQRKKELKLLFPGAFTETTDKDGNIIESVDFEKLKAELGTFSDIYEGRRERYGMDWPGKRDCMKLIQEPTRATLKPCREESVDFDATENLFIEGDNLEVLKLLQKAYYGKIKMIYIDPPYNTGKEFIYPDNYKESLETYLAYAGLIDDEGKKFSTNTANEGRFHTRWLNMMYPRLYLARNLLREDGVIFISIDDNEVDNLRKVCDQMFGEENFCAQYIWNTEGNTDNQYKIKVNHEYVLSYYKNNELSDAAIGCVVDPNTREDSNLWKGIADNNINKNNPENPPSIIELPVGFPCSEQQLFYKGKDVDEYFFEITKKEKFISDEIKKKYHLESKSGLPVKLDDMVVENYKLIKPCRIYVGMANKNKLEEFIDNKCMAIQDEGSELKFYINTNAAVRYRRENANSRNILSVLRNFGTTEKTKTYLKQMGIYYDYPKPVKLIEYLIKIGCEKTDGIVMDFFSGSATCAEAVMNLNFSEKCNKKYIMIQLPEMLSDSQKLDNKNCKTIADISKNRIRRVIEKIGTDYQGSLGFDDVENIDLGFKVLKLDKSNFKQWQPLSAEETSQDEIEKQLDLHVDHIDPNASSDDLLYELLIKAGFMPTEKIEQINLAGKSVYSIANGALLICLEKDITPELIDAVADKQPAQFICLDAAFKENDQLKANAVQTFKSRSRDSETGMVFRVV